MTDEQIERRKELAAVLRAGEYERGVGRLQEKGAERYCCLGVACRVAERHGVPVIVHDDARLKGDVLAGVQCAVESYYGFTSGEQRSLADMNDAATPDGEHMYSWDEIANRIETGGLR